MRNLKNCFLAIVGFLGMALFSSAYAATETLTIQTYYPAPYGAYEKLVVGNGTISSGAVFIVRNSLGADVFATRESDNNLFMFGSWQTSMSDIRLKHNVQPLDEVLNKVLQLRPVSYEWNKEVNIDSKPHYGIIAQEIKDVFPTLVYEDSDGHLNVQRDEMQFILIKAIQEQQKQIEALKEEVRQLKERQH